MDTKKHQLLHEGGGGSGEWGVGRESSAFQFLLVAKLAELVHRILKEFSYLLWTKEIRHQRLHTHESEDPHGLSHHLPRP